MRGNLKAVIGTALSLLLLAWVLRDVSLAEVVHELRRADPLYFFLAVLAATLAMPVRALRWGTLLRPLTPGGVPFRARNTATVVGFAVNNLLPARIGEFARAFTLGRLSGLPVSAAFGSLVVERILDGLVIVAFLFGAMAMPSFPVGNIAGIDPRDAAAVIAAVMGVAAVVLFALVLAPQRFVGSVETLVRRLLPARAERLVLDVLRAFLRGLAVLRDPKLLLLSLLWAVAQWLFISYSYLLAFRAFGITEPGFTGAVFLQSLVGLAVAIPSSPGFFGPFEAAARVGLGLWGVGAEKAVPFAVGFHIGGFIPVSLWGIYYIWKLNLSWGELERSEEAVEERVELETNAPLAERASDG